MTGFVYFLATTLAIIAMAATFHAGRAWMRRKARSDQRFLE